MESARARFAALPMVGVLVAAGIAGCSATPGADPGTTTAPAASAGTSPAGTSSAVGTSPAASAGTSPAGTSSVGTSRTSLPPGTIPGAGVFTVGVDVQPGTYVSETGPEATCYAARLGRRDLPDPLITNYVTRGRSTVTIAPTDQYFETRDCAPWTRR